MKARVEIALRVEEFFKALAPEPRKRLTQGIKALASDQGDTMMLEGRLTGYSRLPVGGYRVIYVERSAQGERIIDSVFAERRGVVYEIFEKLLAEQIGGGPGRK